MSKKAHRIFAFIFSCYLIALTVNTVVTTAQILHDKDFEFSQEIQIFLLSAGMSAVVFAGVFIILYIICLSGGMGLEKIFWVLMISGTIVATGLGLLFENEFHRYTIDTGYFAAISAFSVMVSLASEYQFFHKSDRPAGA
jgi:hypothetical protein